MDIVRKAQQQRAYGFILDRNNLDFTLVISWASQA
jgi:hypothetical protein